MSNKEKVYNYLRSKGLSLASACGIMANIQRESSYNPKAKGDSGTSFGLCQWHKGRWTNLKNYCAQRGLDVNTIEAQVDFLLHEMKTGYKSTYATLDNDNTVNAAENVAYTMCVKYEIPANKTTKGRQRAEIAAELFREFYTTTDSITDPHKQALYAIRDIVEKALMG